MVALAKPDDPQQAVSLAELRTAVGQMPGISDWVCIDQELIDRFAEVTGDHGFIHVDPVRAANTSFGGTIAHGFLTLSLLPYLMRSATPTVDNVRVVVNAGFDRVRFITPVRVGSRVRAHFMLSEIQERKSGLFQFAYDISVEVDGEERPAATARWLLGHWFDEE
jgi:acyl dehydratase